MLRIRLSNLVPDLLHEATSLLKYLQNEYLYWLPFVVGDITELVDEQLFQMQWIRNTLKEYGPTILDSALSSPFVRPLRLLRRCISNFIVTTKNRPSLLQLPDELLLEICSILTISSDPTCPVHGYDCPGGSYHRNSSRIYLLRIEECV